MDKKGYIDEETYSTDLNGYTDFTTVLEYQAPVHYADAFKDAVNTQKIVSHSDIAISNFIRKNKNGEFEFALMETIVPSTLERDGYSGILLEVPFNVDNFMFQLFLTEQEMQIVDYIGFLFLLYLLILTYN